MRGIASLAVSFAAVAGTLLAGCQSGGYSHTASTATAAPQAAPAYAPTGPTYAPSRAPTPSATYTAPAYAPTAGGPIPYDARDISLDQARAAAGGRPVALYILSSTCGYCSRLESSTLTDGGVQGEMRRFYNVRIDSRSP